MKTHAVALLGLAAALGSACSKTQDASTAQATPPSASVAAVATVAASTPPVAPADPGTDSVKAASTSTVPAEPNAPPSHGEHERAAATEIHKGNYKSELDSLEKEDLSADRK
jgi:hypothetical protein